MKTASRKSSKDAATAASPDKLGKHPNHRVVAEEVKQSVRQHLQSLPKVPSHFCRASSGRDYLEPHMTIAKAWRLYVKHMKENHPGKQIAKENQYREIFNTDFNIGIHRPKKDQCEQCVGFANLPKMNKNSNAHHSTRT